ncbi:MAG: MBL fold metallo-hydrolase [Bacteroidia bacterium]|jgi:phosphoribosyl 1,2-cyclic phosphate phosphodiesterase|nr:MBL fold metallo-hydrolase [Bacteroidia bacterium]
MRITFLGTGTSQGVPVIGCRCEVCTSVDTRDERLRTSVLVEVQGKNIVVDSGPDFRQQMLRAKLTRLDGLLLTHAHKDHIAGLDDIRGFNFIQKQAIDVFATTQVQAQLKTEFAYIFSDFKYPGIPELNLFDIDSQTDFMVAQQVLIKPVEVVHFKLPVLGFIFTEPTNSNRFAYITDANFISAEEKEKLKGVHTLVLNALRHEKHISHFTLQEAIALVHELSPSKAYFTHISHQLGTYQNIEPTLPSNMHLAYDGLTIEV